MKGIAQNAWDILLRAGAFFGAALSGIQGGGQLLLIMMGADYFSGFLCAVYGKSKNSPNGQFSLRAALLGLVRKGLMLLVVFLSSALDDYASIGGTLRTATVWFYLCSEGVSVMENLLRLGVPVPARLKKVLGEGK